MIPVVTVHVPGYPVYVYTHKYKQNSFYIQAIIFKVCRSCVYADINIYDVPAVQESIIIRNIHYHFTMALYFFDHTTLQRGTEWPLC